MMRKLKIVIFRLVIYKDKNKKIGDITYGKIFVAHPVILFMYLHSTSIVNTLNINIHTHIHYTVHGYVDVGGCRRSGVKCKSERELNPKAHHRPPLPRTIAHVVRTVSRGSSF